MPSLTFRNLPASKKHAFTKMAFEEFAGKEYHEASVSNIVRKLDIAKGSVYQYFSNKLDLYKYLTREAHNKLVAIQEFVDSRNHNSIGNWFVERVMAQIKFTKEFPSEFELICRVNNTRDNQFLELKNGLRTIELNLIEEKISTFLSDQSQVSAQAFIVWSVIHGYLQDGAFHNLSNDDILEAISNLSQTLFSKEN